MDYPSVVKVFCTSQSPDYNCPWQANTPTSGTGSGVVIGPGQILTGAHVVANATFLQVLKADSPDKVTAHVEAICHDSDLALVRVHDDTFTDGIEPAEVGPLPKLRERVAVVGYPIGGEEVSITEGVVSRIEVQEYSHSQRNLLAVTVDAAINEGNSGGPVFQNGKIAGLAFQVLHDADGIGEVVPATLIHKFLDGVAANAPTVVPGLGIRTQRLENPVLRARVGLSAGQSGVLVTEIAAGNSAYGHVDVGDVLIEIDGLKVANNGTVTYLNRHRTEYPVVMGDHHIGDELTAVVLRNGKQVKLRFKLLPYDLLVPLSQYEVVPTYYIYAGLVFQKLSRDFLRCWDDWWDRAPKEFLYYYYFCLPTDTRTEIVVLSRALADVINVGYEDFYNLSVKAVNGHEPTNMVDFVRHLEAAGDIVELEMSTGTKIVLDTKAAIAANAKILERYHINAPCSPDLIR